jgi:hypothetical protein
MRRIEWSQIIITNAYRNCTQSWTIFANKTPFLSNGLCQSRSLQISVIMWVMWLSGDMYIIARWSAEDMRWTHVVMTWAGKCLRCYSWHNLPLLQSLINVGTAGRFPSIFCQFFWSTMLLPIPEVHQSDTSWSILTFLTNILVTTSRLCKGTTLQVYILPYLLFILLLFILSFYSFPPYSTPFTWYCLPTALYLTAAVVTYLNPTSKYLPSITAL